MRPLLRLRRLRCTGTATAAWELALAGGADLLLARLLAAASADQRAGSTALLHRLAAWAWAWAWQGVVTALRPLPLRTAAWALAATAPTAAWAQAWVEGTWATEGRRAAHPPLQLLRPLQVTTAATLGTALRAPLLLDQRWVRVADGAHLAAAAWATAWALPLQAQLLLRRTGTPGTAAMACRLQAQALQRTGEAACPPQLHLRQAATARALQAGTAPLLPAGGRAGQLRLRLPGQVPTAVEATALLQAGTEAARPLQGLLGTAAGNSLGMAAIADKLQHNGTSGFRLRRALP